ncbi:hypothetical protein L6452_15238 [Arctium lappa]|uniref:Uncharacterized protein n=1 Tax=Arctium lappa TaxID=4217 RepID=A0ACB9CN14_ARCLA|nr:hypothetical protein L6452_15238 [Arctium lappa]
MNFDSKIKSCLAFDVFWDDLLFLVNMAIEGVNAGDPSTERGEGASRPQTLIRVCMHLCMHRRVQGMTGPILVDRNVQDFGATQSVRHSVFDRLSVPKDDELHFGKVKGVSPEQEGLDTVEKPKSTTQEIEESGDQDVTPVSMVVEPVVESAINTPWPPVSAFQTQAKGDFLSSMCRTFTKAKRGRLNTTPFSVLMDMDEEGSVLHGGDEVGKTTEDVESQVSSESGTPPNFSS